MVQSFWLLGVVSLGLFVGLAVYLAPLKPGILELQFAFTPNAFAAVLHQWSPADLQRYRSHFPADFILLLCYGTFGVLSVRAIAAFNSASSRLKRLATLTLPCAAVFDAIENSIHLWLSAAPRFGFASMYLASGSVALAKWLLFIGFAVLITRALLQTEA
jgi:hypothetical protein